MIKNILFFFQYIPYYYVKVWLIIAYDYIILKTFQGFLYNEKTKQR
jgi:hypothetical protein